MNFIVRMKGFCLPPQFSSITYHSFGKMSLSPVYCYSIRILKHRAIGSRTYNEYIVYVSLSEPVMCVRLNMYLVGTHTRAPIH